MCFTGSLQLYAQIGGVTQVTLNAENSGDTIDGLDPQPVYLYDDGGPGEPGTTGEYVGGHDYYIVVGGTCNPVDGDSNYHLSVSLESYDIDCNDTLFIYDGGNIHATPLLILNNCYASRTGTLFSIGPNNTEGLLTVRFKTTYDTTKHNLGFHLSFRCAKACENVIATIDSIYERTDKNGRVISRHTTKLVPDAFDTTFYMENATLTDTIWDDSTHTTFTISTRDTIIKTDSIIRVDTMGWVKGAFLCKGQGIIFHSHGTYTNYTGWYTPHDTSTMFKWEFMVDSLYEIGATTPLCTKFHDVDCYDVVLTLEDMHGCQSRNETKIQVRIAQNPIKTIYDLTPVCSADSLRVSVGYDGDNGTLTLKKIEQSTRKAKINQVRKFIPDGDKCGTDCYYADVTFTEFGGRKVNSAADICSICIKYEHSFMEDYSLAICCPIWDENDANSPGRAILKYKDSRNNPPDYIPGTGGGGGTYTGVPYLIDGQDGKADHIDNDDECDTARNPYGLGFNYCFSLNENYTLVDGSPADITPKPVNTGLGASDFVSNFEYNQAPIPPGYYKAGQHGGPVSCRTKDSSDYYNMTNYYTPAHNFSQLIGCPLNGTWRVQLCDKWKIDNGWVFSWGMDICGVSAGGGCQYQVGIDSVVWHPDTNYQTDFRDGVYRGLQINKKVNDPSIAYIKSPDTSGTFNVLLHIYDEFGCRWDTLTHVSTLFTPTPHLGNDTILCGVNTITLDASDSHTDPSYSSFIWEPTGDTTSTIKTIGGIYKPTTYVVQAINRIPELEISCPARDTIIVDINEQPVPSFDPGLYPLEGCEPFTINIDNTTKYGYKYRWVFGDGTYSTLKNPSHSFSAGTYDLKYYVESDKGCKDSLIYSNLITVHPNPQASFAWDPVFPNVSHPSVSLINNTSPDNGTNKYFWEIQYDKNNPESYHTIIEPSPTFEWTTQGSENDISGSYTVRLIARTDNRGPSGRLIQCTDTIENTIVIINDQLKFPSVVTPNGDGINDRFIIENLVEGLAYPINTLDIYDKWGSRVFHASNISSTDQFWDPAKNNIPAGTYFYRFSGKGYKGNVEHNGVIEVLK